MLPLREDAGTRLFNRSMIMKYGVLVARASALAGGASPMCGLQKRTVSGQTTLGTIEKPSPEAGLPQ